MALLQIFIMIALLTVQQVSGMTADQAAGPLVAGVEEEVVVPPITRIYQTKSVGVALTAKSSLVIDRETGEILWQVQSDESMPIASITKLVTLAMLFSEDRNLDETLVMQQADLRPEGGNRHIYLGEEITIRQALHAALIASDNEATMALVHHFGYDDESFTRAVSAWLTSYGIYDTVIVEPTGLRAQNQSTAHDIALIAQEVFRNSLLRSIAEKAQYSFQTSNTKRTVRLYTTNQLLGTDFHVVLGKTGYTDDAGGCFVALATSPSGHEVISVVLGSDSRSDRFIDTKALLYWVFENFRWNY